MVYRLGGKASSSEGSSAFCPMLVRRMATVTISAPLASTARRVSSKSRYFPVPIKSRERYARPATRSGSAISSARRVGAFIALASADGDDDFERVAVREARLRVAAARNDLAVFFHGDALARELERFEEPRDVCSGLETLHLTVDGELDHFETPRTSG